MSVSDSSVRPGWRQQMDSCFATWDARLVLGLCGLVTLALEWHRAARTPLWFDESVSYWLATLPGSRLGNRIVALDSHPPGYYLILKAWMLAAGESELALRALSLVGAVVGVVGVYVWIRDVYGRGDVAAVGATLAATSEILCFQAANARPYAWLMAAEAWSLVYFTRIWLSPKFPVVRDRAAFVLWSVTGSLLHYHYLFVGAVQLVVALWQAPRRWLDTLVLLGASALPFVWLALPLMRRQFNAPNHLWVPFTTWHTPFSSVLQNYHSWVGLGVLGICVVLWGRGDQAPSRVAWPALGALCLGLWLLPILVGRVLHVYYPNKQGILDIPPLACLVAPAVLRSCRRGGTLLLLALLWASSWASLLPDQFLSYPQSERQLVADLRRFAQPGDVVGAIPMALEPLQYYLHRDWPDNRLVLIANPGDKASWQTALASRRGHILLMHGDATYPHADLDRELEAHFPGAVTWHYAGASGSRLRFFFDSVRVYRIPSVPP